MAEILHPTQKKTFILQRKVNKGRNWTNGKIGSTAEDALLSVLVVAMVGIVEALVVRKNRLIGNLL